MRARYGASPLHLAGHLLLLAVAAFALDEILSGGDIVQLLEWFIGFTLLHDLVLIPLYTGVDCLYRRLLSPGRARRVPLVNHVRAPALISGVLLLVYAPLILRLGDGTYFASSGHHVRGYLRNWLLISLCLFLVSGFAYLIRVWRAGRG